MLTFRHKLRYAKPANPQGKNVAVVPFGMYCDSCPYWKRNPIKPEDSNGFCALLNIGDWMPGELPLLWDSVKMCHIHESSPEDKKRFPPLPFARRRKFTERWGKWHLVFSRDAAWRPRKGHGRAGWKKRGSGPFGP